MDNHAVKVGFYDPFNSFTNVKALIEHKLPLNNLYWRVENSKSQKSIPVLPIKTVEEVPKKTSEKVYLHLAVIQCSSIDTYRAQVRPLLKEWLRLVVQDDDVEWMIVQFVPKNTKDHHSNLIKLSILDKLNVDFGMDGKELPNELVNRKPSRILKLKEHYDDPTKKSEAINEFITLIKENLLLSFTTRYNKYAQGSSKYDQLSLAELFKDMQLFEDSLKIYSRLSQDANNSAPLKFSIPDNLEGYRLDNSFQLSLQNALDDTFQLKSVLFLQQAQLLISLANSANAPTLVAQHLATLYQKLLIFLHDIISKVPGQKVHEWAYVVSENYLELPINMKNDQMAEVLEYRGELRLFQRSQLLKLGSLSYKYNIYGSHAILEEISFDNISLEDDDSTISTEIHPITYKGLSEILASEESFYDKFQEITELTIRDFRLSPRQNSIDVLSIDIALVQFHRKHYKEALDILGNSFDFFINNGWNFMGGMLLDAYISCLEKVAEIPDYPLMIQMCLKLLGNLKNGHGINNYGVLKTGENIPRLFKKIYEYSNYLTKIVESDLSNIFIIEVIPYIQVDCNILRDEYYIELKLQSLFAVDIPIEKIELEIQKNNSTIVFHHENITINKEGKETTIRLISRSFEYGFFDLVKLSISLNENLKLVKRFESNINSNNSDSLENIEDSYSSVLITKNQIDIDNEKTSCSLLFCQKKNKLWMEFVNPLNINLQVNTLVLRIHCGSCNIENPRVFITSQTSGVVISLNDIANMNNNCKVQNDSSIGFRNLDKLEDFDLQIPFTYFGDNKILSLTAVLYYEIDNFQYSNVIRNEIDTSLSISVSVQDIFKLDHIFSNFQVGTSNSKKPIKIISTELECESDKYNIIKPIVSANDIIAFGDQPASFFYKIEPLPDYKISYDDKFDLKIRYQNIIDDLHMKFEQFIQSKLENDHLDYYIFFLRSQIFSKIQFDMNYYSLYGSVKILNNEVCYIIANEAITKHIFEPKHQQILLDILKNIFLETSAIDLNSQNYKSTDTRSLHISVPIPILRVLQVVKFTYEKKPQFSVGEPIEVKLHITPSIKWWAAQDSQEDSTQKISIEEFQVNILPEENWLISGFKKTKFHVDYSSEHPQILDLDLIIIPLNVGKLLLPKVEVKSLTEIKDGSSMDVINKNGSESLLVVPELDSITFSF